MGNILRLLKINVQEFKEEDNGNYFIYTLHIIIIILMAWGKYIFIIILHTTSL